MALNIKHWLTVKKLTWLLAGAAIACLIFSALSYQRIQQIKAFNKAVSVGEPPATDKESFEAKFATALYLAKKERYKEAALLFTKLMQNADNSQKATIQYNLGNIFFLRGLAINGTSMTVRNEAEYYIRQAKTAYQTSLKLDNNHWDVRHNFDRLLTMLPGTPTPGVGESDTPGLIMGNIPVGLP
jgi:mxaK protein